MFGFFAKSIDNQTSVRYNNIMKHMFGTNIRFYRCGGEEMMLNNKIRISMLAILAIVLFTVFLLFVLPVGRVEASDEQQKTAADYVSYVVRSGDTLWDIADSHLSDRYPTHAEYINELMRVNGLKNSDIFEGELIVIPRD